MMSQQHVEIVQARLDLFWSRIEHRDEREATCLLKEVIGGEKKML